MLCALMSALRRTVLERSAHVLLTLIRCRVSSASPGKAVAHREWGNGSPLPAYSQLNPAELHHHGSCPLLLVAVGI